MTATSMYAGDIRLEHTMGERLRDYVVPKVPTRLLHHGAGEARVYANRSLSLLLDAGKRTKRFNWRRPYFTNVDGVAHCVVPPGRDYAHHYGQLIESAAAFTGVDLRVEVELPHRAMTLEFIDYWLPPTLPRASCVLLGYVEHLFAASPGEWHLDTGFGWRLVTVSERPVLLLGCEFSYWGDIAGALVEILGQRRSTDRVIYVGKLGSLRPEMVPNRTIATGTSSRVGGRVISWTSSLALESDHDVRTGQRHVTQPSVVDETRAWRDQHAADFDLVDPEIGHMACAANRTGIGFDYLHVVTDNLSHPYEHGLYDERGADITRERRRSLARIESILNRSLS